MDSFISYNSKNIVNGVMDGVELDDVKLRYIEIIKGSDNVVISSETEQNWLPFAGRILP